MADGTKDVELPARVVVATDFSPGAARGLRRVQHLPFAPGAEVTVVHVRPPADVAIDPARVEAHAKALLERELATLRSALQKRARADVQVRAALPEGTPSLALLELARRKRADLLVVGRHGAGRLRGFLLGSTAERLTHAADAPVLVVGPQPRGAYASPLVALADSEGSTFVLDETLRIIPPRRRLDAVTAAFVPMEGWLWGSGTPTREVLRIKALTKKRARDVVEPALAPYRERGLRVRWSLRDGEPREVLLDQTRRLRADLIAIGTHARGGLVRFRLGSVAAHVIRHATTCDVLVARPPGLLTGAP